VPIGLDERVALVLSRAGGDLLIDVEAPFHDDPMPAGSPGPTDGLWNHEVVELFIVGADARYVEVELSPHGHHLVLQLHGVRTPTASLLPLDYSAVIDGGRWRGRARLDARVIPPGPHAINAFAIHGAGNGRRYLAATAVPGPEPDFHRLHLFPTVVLP
jgi:hypothetical protein